MWRQADNPLAPSDKYEARRAFSAFSRHYARLSMVRGWKRKEKAIGRSLFSTRGESLSQRVRAATDRPSSNLSITDPRIFFRSLPAFEAAYSFSLVTLAICISL